MMWGNLESFCQDIIIAAFISGLGFVCGKIGKKVRSFIYKRTISFSLDGIWYAFHVNYQGERIIELIHFRQNREDLLVKIIQYKEGRQNIYTFLGKGIFTTDTISLFYYSDHENLRQNGVMTLKIMTHNINEVYMDGTYYEINSEKSKHQGFYPLGTYKVYRLKIPFLKRVDFYLKRGIFLNYLQVENTVKKYGETK